MQAARVVSSGAPGWRKRIRSCQRWCAVPQIVRAREAGASSQCIENDAPERRATVKSSRVHSRDFLSRSMGRNVSARVVEGDKVVLTRRGVNRMTLVRALLNAGRDHDGMLVSEKVTSVHARYFKQRTGKDSGSVLQFARTKKSCSPDAANNER